MRLDVWLVEQGKVRTRAKAQALVKGGFVSCNGKTIDKASYDIMDDAVVEVRESDLLKYVSRGGLKLEKAIETFNLDFHGKRILDIGSSTGGFTDCALQHGALSVLAVDVGHGLMAPELAANPAVELHEETDIRNLPLERFADIDFVVCDVSFVSLLTVIPPVCQAPGNFELVLLIKPQFECGAKIARRFKGVIKDRQVHIDVLTHVLEGLQNLSLCLKDITPSPIRGGDGNIEYITHFLRGNSHAPLPDIKALVNEAATANISQVLHI